MRVQGLEEELGESEKTVRNLQTQLTGYVKDEKALKQLTIEELARRMANNAITKSMHCSSDHITGVLCAGVVNTVAVYCVTTNEHLTGQVELLQLSLEAAQEKVKCLQGLS